MYPFEGVVALCSRGVTMTEVLDGIIRNIMQRVYNVGMPWTIRSTWDLDIPEAQNEVVKKCLRLEPEFVWFVEEDTVPPSGILSRMLMYALQADVVVADYKMDGGGSVLVRDEKQNVERGGLGCSLFRSSLFEKIPYPWFETGLWARMSDGSYAKQGGVPGYGTQDISLFIKLKDLGARIVEVPGMQCKHLRFEEPGKLHTNKGVHKIREI